MTGAVYFSVVFNPYRCMLKKSPKKMDYENTEKYMEYRWFFSTDNDFF